MADIDPRWNTAAAESLSAWGISLASVHLVSHSKNLVYRIETDNGTYGLRVHHPGYHTRQELISEQQWIAALANSGCSVPTPQLTLTGDGLATATISGEASRSASLVKWANGDLLGSRLENAPRADRLGLIREIGATNARLHAAASAWKAPAGYRRTHWDADGLMGDYPVWGRFWEVPGLSVHQRGLLLRTRDRFKERLDGLAIAPGQYGLIHSDMHPYNMIWSDAGIHVIDFDDAGFGWQAYDVAVALYNYRRDTEFDSIRAAFINGYQSVRPIGDSTRENLGFFFVVRSLVWLGWINDRPDLFSSKRLVQAIDLVYVEAAAYSQHP